MSFAKIFLPKNTRHCIVCRERCPVSYATLSDYKLCICKDCREKIEHYKSPAVFAGGSFLKFLICAYPYSGVLKDSFMQYKFFGQRAYGTLFSELLCDSAAHFMKKGDFDLIIPVPLSSKRMKERGFNQSAIMALELSQRFETDYSERVLFRIRHTERQSKLNSAARTINVKGAFFADKRFAEGKRILLTDDIYTVGATMNECARVLSESGAAMVAGITLFKSHIYEKTKEIYNFDLHSDGAKEKNTKN